MTDRSAQPNRKGTVALALPYRPCVGIMLINGENRIFVGQRLDRFVEAWQMPQGGIDPGELPISAAFRELEEEIGTKEAVVLGESRHWLTYDLPDDLVGRVWKGRYRGQIQKWFLMRFTAEDSAIDLKTRHPEFGSWKWITGDSLLASIVSFKREVYAEIAEEFGEYLSKGK